MPHRIIEPIVIAPVAAGIATTGLASATPNDWISVLIGPASGLAVSLLVLWFLKGYYDRALSREAENRADIREMLERVIDISAKQHEQGERCADIIEENTQQTRAAAALMQSVSATLTKCHENHRP